MFKVDRTLSREFQDPYFMCLDLTTGKTSAQPPIQMFSLKGKDFIFNEVLGVDKIQRSLIVILDL